MSTKLSGVSSNGADKEFQQRVQSALQQLGLFLNPFDNIEGELKLILKVCTGRSHREILVHLLRHGPSRFIEIRRGTSVSETQVVKSLKKMVESGIIRKRGRAYDISLRGLLWIREKKAKPSILLTLG